MNTFKLILTSTALFFILGSTFSLMANEKIGPPRVVDAGPDGDERFYGVFCGDGTQAAVMKKEDKKTVCTTPKGKQEDVCKEWSVDEAARAACGYKS